VNNMHDEIRQVIQTLLSHSKNNQVVVGDTGTGKTASPEGTVHGHRAG